MSKLETVREIITVASILIKFGAEDILQGKSDEFVAFLNEIGIRNEGRELNVASFKKMIKELSLEDKEILVEEFNEGYADVYRHMAMYANR
ncbi:anti-sigma factor [Erwinia phage Cronus]|uniref:Anti-sigma factor n=1 Tax=Erwinia phage Cronus TaxID=2163633 RepID=A0A2S1GM14_9CAUD|nr:anti-sigma factor [Erwinia phage Cronus]AWD90419.1 anti-sigma factor [Erwinia phage Cronus]